MNARAGQTKELVLDLVDLIGGRGDNGGASSDEVDRAFVTGVKVKPAAQPQSRPNNGNGSARGIVVNKNRRIDAKPQNLIPFDEDGFNDF